MKYAAIVLVSLGMPILGYCLTDNLDVFGGLLVVGLALAPLALFFASEK